MGVANLHHRLQLKAPSCIGADFALGAAMAGCSIADEAAAAEVNAAMVADLVACFMARVDEASEAANSFVGNSLESAAAEPWDDAVPQQIDDPEGASSQTSPPSAEGGADAGDDEGGESIEVPLDFVVASHDPYLPIGPAEEARAEEPAEEAGAEEPDQDRSLKKPKLEEVKAEPVEEAGAEDPAEEAGAEALPVLVKEMERLERQNKFLEDTSLDVDVLELLTNRCEAKATMQQERLPQTHAEKSSSISDPRLHVPRKVEVSATASDPPGVAAAPCAVPCARTRAVAPWRVPMQPAPPPPQHLLGKARWPPAEPAWPAQSASGTWSQSSWQQQSWHGQEQCWHGQQQSWHGQQQQSWHGQQQWAWAATAAACELVCAAAAACELASAAVAGKAAANSSHNRCSSSHRKNQRRAARQMGRLLHHWASAERVAQWSAGGVPDRLPQSSCTKWLSADERPCVQTANHRPLREVWKAIIMSQW